MEFTAKQIADVIGGRVEGDENAKIHTFAKIEEGKEGTITFLSNPKYTHFIYETKASIVLINNDVELEHPVSATLIRVPNAYECVAKLMQMYAASLPKKKGIDPLAFVSKTAEIGKDVYIGPFTYVGEGVKIGDGCLIYPHVTIYDGCQIGNNVTIHAGAVIGADGFGFAPNQEGYDKIPQMGIVVIEAKRVMTRFHRWVSSSLKTMWRLVPIRVLTARRWARRCCIRVLSSTTLSKWLTTARLARTL